MGDNHSPIDRKFAERRKNGEGPELVPPTKITIRFDTKGGGMVIFEKESLLLQEEINCVLDVFRKCASRNEDAAVVASPEQKLAELEVVLSQARFFRIHLLLKGIVGHLPHAEAPERNPFR